ncbi:MAG: hypothetical protein V7634_3443 [Bradyrhizobium sp.]|jgi:hypothetical protein
MLSQPFRDPKAITRQFDAADHDIDGDPSVIKQLDCFVGGSRLSNLVAASSEIVGERHAHQHVFLGNQDGTVLNASLVSLHVDQPTDNPLRS